MIHRKPHNYFIGRLSVIATVGLMALMCACSKAVPAEMLSHADHAIARGDTTDALQCCQSLDDADLTPSQLCHRAIIYAKIAQIGNNPEHMASAAANLKQAIGQSPDSVMGFAAGLPFAESAMLNEIYCLCDIEIDAESLYDSADSLDIAF